MMTPFSLFYHLPDITWHGPAITMEFVRGAVTTRGSVPKLGNHPGPARRAEPCLRKREFLSNPSLAFRPPQWNHLCQGKPAPSAPILPGYFLPEKEVDQRRLFVWREMAFLLRGSTPATAGWR